MKVSSEKSKVNGYQIHRYVVEPDQASHLGVVINHGQGDFAERYLDVAERLIELGLTVVIHDFPGHGHSGGRRGHIPNVETVNAIIGESIERLNGLDFGVIGHSMGGLITKNFLVEASRGAYPLPKFCWLSSPLIRPTNGRSAWFVNLVKLIAPIVPSITIDTGVTPEMCRSTVPQNPEDVEILKFEQGHTRISMGWGCELVYLEEKLAEQISHISEDIPLLITQGNEDPVCPVEFIEDLFPSFPNKQKQLIVLEGMLHEPFADDGSDQLFDQLLPWIDNLFPNPVKP